jgi:hypothetical protein
MRSLGTSEGMELIPFQPVHRGKLRLVRMGERVQAGFLLSALDEQQRLKFVREVLNPTPPRWRLLRRSWIPLTLIRA